MGYRVAVDFDGTIVEHDFPKIGKPVPGAIEWLREWRKCGATLILWTMRSDNDEGDFLKAAVSYCRVRGVEFDYVNSVPSDRIWTLSPKVHAHVYVDDAAFGCPLIAVPGGRPVVDWSVVGPRVQEKILTVP